MAQKGYPKPPTPHPALAPRPKSEPMVPPRSPSPSKRINSPLPTNAPNQ